MTVGTSIQLELIETPSGILSSHGLPNGNFWEDFAG
jgi:hypothetical protein